jgi:vesicle-fusing ATPase
VVDPTDLSRALDLAKVCVTQSDFLMAADETSAAFGAKEDELERMCREGVIGFGEEFAAIVTTMRRLIRQSLASARSPMLTACLCGAHGAGKTALAVRLALDSGIPMIKRIGAEDMLGTTSLGKVRVLHEAFEDAYKSSQSLLILDDIERMMEYVPLGRHFNNEVLQALLVLLRRGPPKDGRRLLVICTTSEPGFLRDVGLLTVFTVVERLAHVETQQHYTAVLEEAAGDVMAPEEIAKAAADLAGQAMPIKRVMQVLEMARQAERDKAMEASGITDEDAVSASEAAAASGAGGSAVSTGAPPTDIPITLTALTVLDAAAASTDGARGLMMDLAE